MIVGLVILAVMVIAAGPALGAIYRLRAEVTTMEMPDGSQIPMWGYSLRNYNIGNGNIVVNGPVQVPGPRLTVPQGQRLRVVLINRLPVPTSIIIPGQMEDTPSVTRNPDGRIRSFTRESAADSRWAGRVTYTWSNIEPGTYLYHSGTHPAVQVQMGLYGGVSKNHLDANRRRIARAYPGVAYDTDAMLIYSEIDPALHQAVADGTYGTVAYPSTIDYYPKYFLVNGVAADSSGPLATVSAGNTVLLRLLNAGLKDHAPQILGTHVSIVAEDGNLYPYHREHHTLFLPAGKTLDAVFSPTTPGEQHAIFDRRAFKTTAASVEGSMHAYISVNGDPP